MNKTFKTAIVGCGTISANHLTALAELDNVTVTALCDLIPERAEKKISEFSLTSRIYTDYKEMLDTEELDAVHIATPHYLHAEMAIEALSRNINVFLEKPMCITREEIAALLEAEKKSSAKITVCFQNRYNPATLAAKKIIDADGGALSAYGSVFWERGAAYYTESGWRGSYATEGGGVMINQAIHTIDLLCAFLGKPEKLWATKANHHLKGVIEVEDSCEGMILFESGKYGNFYATTSFHGCDIVDIVIKTKNHKVELRNNKLYVDDVLIREEDTTTYVGKAVYGNGHKYMITKFYEAIEGKCEVPVTLESAQYALRILLAAYESNDNETIV